MVNLGNPDLAFQTAMMPNDGVGLARMEFIISEHIGVHPMALVHPEKLTGDGARAHRSAERATIGSPRDFFVEHAGGGRRHDRGGLLSEAGDRPAVRLQDQRICAAARRCRRSSRRKTTRCSASAAPRAMRIRPMPTGFALECAALRRVRERDGADATCASWCRSAAASRRRSRCSRRWRATGCSAARTGWRST